MAAAKAGRLAGYVHVNGSVYGPDDAVPSDVAKEITNPKAWSESPSEDDGYDALTVEEIREEIDKRNASRPDAETLSKTGLKADLIASLEADDAKASGTA